MIRFTIRDVLWLTVVVALAVSWFVHWTSSRARYEELQKVHLHLLTKQGNASMAGVNQMVAQMRERGDLQRKYMEEKKKGLEYKVEFSNRLQQELSNARRADAEQANKVRASAAKDAKE